MTRGKFYSSDFKCYELLSVEDRHLQGLYEIVGTPHSLVHLFKFSFLTEIFIQVSFFLNTVTVNVFFSLLIGLFSVSVQFSLIFRYKA